MSLAVSKMDFEEISKIRNWKPIRNCPGRYLLSEPNPSPDLEDLLGGPVEAREYRVEKARDAVVVVKLDHGGIISFKRADGSFLHTLNTPEGFERKLAQLGIEI